MCVCLGELKHWQRKATGLSKDMQRMLNQGNDLIQLKEENLNLFKKVEVCIET